MQPNPSIKGTASGLRPPTAPVPLNFGVFMIVEYIRYKLNERPSESGENAVGSFEVAYRAAASSLDASPHCLGYELSCCVEEQGRYILRIEWDSVEGHLAGFRRAPEFAPFLAAIKPYISQIEEMQHYTLTSVVSSKRK
jgi:quinol monooxygenase YgiN